MKTVETHPADDDIDTGVFKAITDDFIAATEQPPSSVPPTSDFSQSEAVRSLSKTQSEVSRRLQNIMFLTRPPTFPDDE